MDTSPKEKCQKHSPSSESDLEDDIPLARLKNKAHNEHASSSEDDEPLATLRARSPLLSEVNLDEFLDDSVADPEYKLGKCEVRRCNDEVWAACEECEILLCYDHFQEEETCDNHGKSYSKVQQKTKFRKRQGENKGQVTEGEGHGGQEREVTHILHTAEEETATLRGRKRTRNEENWKRNVRKRCRTSGKPYVSSRGKEIAGRTMKTSCPDSCKLKCSTKFNENERNSIFRDYWGNADKREQQHYLLRHVEEIPVIRKRVGSEKRNTTMHYYFYRHNTREKEQVCRTFFLNTLDIRADLVYRTFKKVMDTGGLQQSTQGKHASKNKIDECLLQGVRDHISSFQVVDSHYCRADSVKKYLDPSLSVAGMYRLYQRACEENGQEKVCEDRYRKIFDYEFNLGFHRPKKDQCEICISYKNKQGGMTEEDQQLFQKHMENKTTARHIKNSAKEDKCPNKTSCSFDLQQILLCPHGQSSSYFYKRRLGVFNFTIYDYKKGDAFCYMWPESEGRRGSNEVATCLHSYIAQQARKNSVKDVSMFSDNCAGQNRNRFVAFALHFVRSELQMNSITHTFLEKGHTETENDSVHATIERKTRHIELYTPEQWVAAVRTARASKQPYHVKEMTSHDFIDFKFMAGTVRNLSVDDAGEKVAWSKVRQVIAKAEDPEALHIRTKYDGPTQRLNLNRRKRITGDAVYACMVKVKKGLSKPGVPEAKKQDLLALCDSGQIPSAYRPFYASLPVGGDGAADEED